MSNNRIIEESYGNGSKIWRLAEGGVITMVPRGDPDAEIARLRAEIARLRAELADLKH